MWGKSTTGFFGTCCSRGRDGVINPLPSNTWNESESDPKIMVHSTCHESKSSTSLSTCTEECNNKTRIPAIPAAKDLAVTSSQQSQLSPQGHGSGDRVNSPNEEDTRCEKSGDEHRDVMADLESPHYVKRTAHIFQSQSHSTITHGNGISRRDSSPSYISVARSVSGYSSLSYNNGHTKIDQCQTVSFGKSENERWRCPVRNHPPSAPSAFRPSLSTCNNDPPPLPKSAPPLASPSLVGQTIFQRNNSRDLEDVDATDSSTFRSTIQDRIQRLYGNLEGESKTVFWKSKSPAQHWAPAHSPSPPVNEILIPISLECPEDKSVTGDVGDLTEEIKIDISRDKDTPAESSLQVERVTGLESTPSNKMSPVLLNKENQSVTKDGEYFLRQLNTEKGKIEQLIEKTEAQLSDEDPNGDEHEDGKVRAAIGKARLLINKKFKQFEGLCHTNLDQKLNGIPEDEPFPTKDEDLEGFWDMVLLQVDHIHEIFKELDPNYSPEPKKPVESVKKCPLTKSLALNKNGTKVKATNQSSNTSAADANRRKLLAEKRKAMKALAPLNQVDQESTNGNCTHDIEILS